MSKLRHVGLLVAGFLALSVSTSFGVDANKATPSSAVLINSAQGSGSGVYIGDDRVLTAAHVVAKHGDVDKDVKVFVTVSRNDAPAESIGAKVIGYDPSEDIALLKLDLTIPDLLGAKLACRAPVVGEQIETVGSPLGLTFVHSWGRVAGVMRATTDWRHAVPIDLNVAPGNSGGPVYDKDGKVLGLAIGLAYGGDGEKIVSPGTVSIMVSVLPVCKHLGLPYDEVAASAETGLSVVSPATKTRVAGHVTSAPACENPVSDFLARAVYESLTVQKFEGNDYFKYVAAFDKIMGQTTDASGGDALYVISFAGSPSALTVQAKNGCIVTIGGISAELNDKILDAMKAAA